MPGVFTTVVGFGQVSALSTRLAAALLREKTVGTVEDTHQSGGKHSVSMTFKQKVHLSRPGAGQVDDQRSP